MREIWQNVKSGWADFKCHSLNRHSFVSIAYGYPEYKQTWVDVEVCTNCFTTRITFDDLFIGKRPKQYDCNVRFMNYTCKEAILITDVIFKSRFRNERDFVDYENISFNAEGKRVCSKLINSLPFKKP